MPLSSPTIKALFAKSMNKCAFPGCQANIAEDNGTIIGEVCHIEAYKEGGPRYNIAQSEGERQSLENLILMCANHHKLIDRNPSIYTVDYLKEMKRNHEQGHAEDISLSEDFVDRVVEGLLQPFSVTGSFYGPTVISHGQMGGQTAYNIENYGLRPRQITRAAAGALISELREYPSESFYIQCVDGDHEVLDFAESLIAVLSYAGWKNSGISVIARHPPLVRWGIRLFAPDNPSVHSFLSWLKKISSYVEPHINECGSVTIQIGPNR